MIEVDEIANRQFTLATSLLVSDTERCLEILQSLHSRYPEHYGITGYMGYVLRQLGRFDEAAQAYRIVLQTKPHSVSAHEGLCLALWELGDSTQAILSLKEAVALVDDPILLEMLTELSGQVGRLEEGSSD